MHNANNANFFKEVNTYDKQKMYKLSFLNIQNMYIHNYNKYKERLIILYRDHSPQDK